MNSQSRFQFQTMKRRTLLRGTGTAALGLAGAATIGCGDDDEVDDNEVPTSGATSVAGGPSPIPEPRSGDLRFHWTPIAEEMDPAKSVSAAASLWQTIGNLALVADKQTWDIKGALVEKWESPSPTELILHVREGVSWHDKPPVGGRNVTAEDIAYSINRHAAKLDPDNAARYHRRGNFLGLDKASVVDEKTVRLTLTSPSSVLLNGMADQRVSMMPIEHEQIGFANPSQLIGSGPWVIDTMSSDGRGKLKANESYGEGGLPKSATLSMEVLADPQAQTASFLANQVDFLNMTNKPATEVDLVAKQRSDAGRVVWDFGYFHYLRFNTEQKPFDDARVRRALQLALDHKSIATGFYGDLWQYTGPLTATFVKEAYSPAEISKLPGWNPATKEKDIKDAKALLESAGFANGAGISMTLLGFSNGPQLANAERARAQWLNVFPQISIDLQGNLDSVTFFNRVNSRQWGVLAYAQFPSPDAITELGTNYTLSGGRNYGKYDNAKVTDLIQKALAETDTATRSSLAKQVQDIVIEDMPIIAMYYPKQVTYTAKEWTGLDGFPGPAGGAYWDIWEGSKFIKTSR